MAKASDNPYPSILLVEQASTPATPAAGSARLYRGTDNNLYVVDDTGTATQVGGSSGGQTTLDIAVVSTGYTPSTSTTFTNVTGAAVTFAAPTSGTVLIDVQFGFSVSAASTSLEVALQESGTNLTGSLRRMYRDTGGAIYQGQGRYRHIATGLTPGSTHTYQFVVHRGDGTGTVTIETDASSVWGDLIMEARTVPAP